VNEQEFGRRIAGHLSAGAEAVSLAVATRLFEARQRALSAFPSDERFVAHGVLALGRRMQAWHYAAVLVLAFAGVFTFSAYRTTNEGVDVEIAVLAGDLPPAAYLDKDFNQWLNCARDR
jgi:type VI protein secretion system component VasF